MAAARRHRATPTAARVRLKSGVWSDMEHAASCLPRHELKGVLRVAVGPAVAGDDEGRVAKTAADRGVEVHGIVVTLLLPHGFAADQSSTRRVRRADTSILRRLAALEGGRYEDVS